jgi:hypothetical protein
VSGGRPASRSREASDRRPRPQLVEAEFELAVEAVERDRVRCRLDERHVVVHEHVVHARRGHVGAQRFERHAVVAGGLRQLVEPDAVFACASHGRMQARFSPARDLAPSVTPVTERPSIEP